MHLDWRMFPFSAMTDIKTHVFRIVGPVERIDARPELKAYISNWSEIDGKAIFIPVLRNVRLHAKGGGWGYEWVKQAVEAKQLCIEYQTAGQFSSILKSGEINISRLATFVYE